MPKITINDQEVEVQDGSTVMQACHEIGLEVPHFCYHKKLEIAGNCRMCLVEMERSPKPIASCATIAVDGMKIYTNTPGVQKAREGVMEFLLINHPLDCPICDQGGECDLQDQAFKYGSRKNRFSENKRCVKDKNLGPLIKTHMTRCIHCTRCIRFATDIAGVAEIGAINRGEDMEITSYLEKTLTSELSGNVIDLCPVGALTSKPYAFTARSWELKKTNSIDIMDAMGSHIRIDSKGNEVMRILPQNNDEINEEWISDKARFSYDGLKVQRLDRPYVRINRKLEPTSWHKAIKMVASQIQQVQNMEIASIIGATTSCETMFALKKLFNKLGTQKIDANQFGYKFDLKARGNYLFNTTIEKAGEADICLLVGSNIRYSAPVLNARIGQSVRQGKMQVYGLGVFGDQTYRIENLSDDLTILQNILDNKHFLSQKLSSAKKPMIIIGDEIYSRADAGSILELLQEIVVKYQIIKGDWNGYNILHNQANMVGALDIGVLYDQDNGQDSGQDSHGTAEILSQTQTGKVKILFLVNADDIDCNQIADDCFVIYQGHHGDASASRADVILPQGAYTEEDGIFVNMEGRAQYASLAIKPLGEARAGLDIIINLAQELNIDLGFSNLDEVRKELADKYPVFANMEHVLGSECSFVINKDERKIAASPIKAIARNYYMDNVICKFSATMAKCISALNDLKQEG